MGEWKTYHINNGFIGNDNLQFVDELGDCLFIRFLLVHPNYRNQKIGTNLCNATILMGEALRQGEVFTKPFTEEQTKKTIIKAVLADFNTNAAKIGNSLNFSQNYLGKCKNEITNAFFDFYLYVRKY